MHEEMTLTRSDIGFDAAMVKRLADRQLASGKPVAAQNMNWTCRIP